MKRRGWTILVLSDTDSPVRTLHVPTWLVRGAISVVAALMVAVGLFGFLYLRASTSGTTLVALQQQNTALHSTVMELASAVGGLRDRLNRGQEMENHLRTLADLPAVHADVRQVGVGGTSLPPHAYGEDALGDRYMLLEDLGQRLDHMGRQVRLQNESYREILASLEGRRDDLAHTPSIRPVEGGYFSSGFGNRGDPFTGKTVFHYGIDIVADKGTPVVATADGVVCRAGFERLYGRIVEIDHGNGFVTVYAHNDVILVKRGDHVARGQAIAKVGRTGRCTGSHLHYEVQKDGKAVNPWSYMLDNLLALRQSN